MTANAGYHAYATGDVLTAAQVQYNLQNQTVMYFASSAARTTALSGVLVEGMVSYIPANGLEYYNGSAWVVVAADQTPLTTKGDLFTYSTTDARLAIGTNGQTLVANSGATTGNAWQDPVQQNPVLNSAFQVWQRGTSISVAASSTGYTADRWYTATNANQACTISRQATGDTTNLPNIQYCMRFQRNSGQTGTGQLTIAQSFESVNAIPFAGKTVILSFYARAGANYSPTSSALLPIIYTGTGTDQNALSGYTGNVTNYTSVTLTTTWQRFTYSITVPITATEIAPAFGMNPTGTAGTNDYYEVTGVQLEVGSVATPFHTFSATIQGELSAAQRYYMRLSSAGASANYGLGYAYSTTSVANQLRNPVTMRITPTTLDYSNIELTIVGVSNYAITGLAIDAGTSGPDYVTLLATGASGLTANRPYSLKNTAATGFIGLSAEL